MAEEGSIVIGVDLDDKKAQAELNRLDKKIEKLNEDLTEKRGKRSALEDTANEVGAQVDETRKKVEDLRKELG